MRFVMLALALISVNLEFLFTWLALMQRVAPKTVAFGAGLVSAGLVSLAWALGQGLELILPAWVVGGSGLVPLVWALHAPQPAPVSAPAPLPTVAATSPLAAVIATALVLTARCQLTLFLPVMAGVSAWTLLGAVGLVGGLTVGLLYSLQGLARHPALAATITARAKASATTCYVLAGAFVAVDTGLVDQLVKVVSA
ncbi:hypothetical protein [Lacticaseibacillus absianus]|uniref:hypothetical protein n=1 Tax=Lacticaseibacillus absianus TaxID=2729623 RepID=UPI0015C9C12A|nr:hypothetical protein [Lacticaseibacillus absianus]